RLTQGDDSPVALQPARYRRARLPRSIGSGTGLAECDRFHRPCADTTHAVQRHVTLLGYALPRGTTSLEVVGLAHGWRPTDTPTKIRIRQQRRVHVARAEVSELSALFRRADRVADRNLDHDHGDELARVPDYRVGALAGSRWIRLAVSGLSA